MKVRAFLAALLIGGAALAEPVRAQSITYEERDTAQDHIELLDTLVDLGIDVQINNPSICNKEEGVAGYWMGARKLFVLCQQSIRSAKLPYYTGEIVTASDDDLDTIRHEAHHVIQDCKDGKIDGRLDHYFTPENLVTFLDNYPDWKEDHVRESYAEFGESNHVIELEVEAWAVADLVEASTINEVLIRECKV